MIKFDRYNFDKEDFLINLNKHNDVNLNFGLDQLNIYYDHSSDFEHFELWHNGDWIADFKFAKQIFLFVLFEFY